MLVTAAYLCVLTSLAVFGLHRLHLVWLAWRHEEGPAPPAPSSWPRVTVQLPLYNEAAVARRLIEAVSALDYPADLLEVQVLDDSSDETQAIVADAVSRAAARGLRIRHVRRPTRSGYKAGALAHGLQTAEGELIAIFDADFVPAPDFLRRTVPWFQERELGLVQGCWTHLNRDASSLTRLQALALDAHFRVEQAARSRSGRFFNFNGTAGVWRREAIEAAGGWASDTITEDLDLSLRSQLCGWRFRFLEGVEVPSELPEDLAAFRAQQRRWTRGSGQTARKLLGHVWRTPGVPLRARVEATFQLLLNAAYPLSLLLALLTVPLVLAERTELLALQWALFALATASVTLFYVASQAHRGARGLLAGLRDTPLLFACGLGLSLSNGLAFLRGLGGGRADFVRTPKRGDASARYRIPANAGFGVAELGLGLYACAGLGWSLWRGLPWAAPFLALIALGFLAVGLGTLWPSEPAPLELEDHLLLAVDDDRDPTHRAAEGEELGHGEVPVAERVPVA
ncbi:MAG TPA: glycosyl transferase family 2 [Planctomycetes bacterium]|nr:glycosyl transferase family 2 [Planctomycetota bacterium]